MNFVIEKGAGHDKLCFLLFFFIPISIFRFCCCLPFIVAICILCHCIIVVGSRKINKLKLLTLLFFFEHFWRLVLSKQANRMQVFGLLLANREVPQIIIIQSTVAIRESSQF